MPLAFQGDYQFDSSCFERAQNASPWPAGQRLAHAAGVHVLLAAWEVTTPRAAGQWAYGGARVW